MIASVALLSAVLAAVHGIIPAHHASAVADSGTLDHIGRWCERQRGRGFVTPGLALNNTVPAVLLWAGACYMHVRNTYALAVTRTADNLLRTCENYDVPGAGWRRHAALLQADWLIDIIRRFNESRFAQYVDGYGVGVHKYGATWYHAPYSVNNVWDTPFDLTHLWGDGEPGPYPYAFVDNHTYKLKDVPATTTGMTVCQAYYPAPKGRGDMWFRRSASVRARPVANYTLANIADTPRAWLCAEHCRRSPQCHAAAHSAQAALCILAVDIQLGDGLGTPDDAFDVYHKFAGVGGVGA